MYLKRLTITNFRKFGTNNNVIEFVDAKDHLQKEEINISSATTLIVGKNNSGKTTVSIALYKLLENGKFHANDFNFKYLDELLKTYLKNNFISSPYLEFIIDIGFEINSHDLITNLAPFIKIENLKNQEQSQEQSQEKCLTIKVRYELVEVEQFKQNVRNIITEANTKKEVNQDLTSSDIFSKFIQLINNSEFRTSYFDNKNNPVTAKFSLKDLINLELVSANKTITDDSLSRAFNKILKLKYKEDIDLSDLSKHIDTINNEVTKSVSGFSTSNVNPVLHSIEDSKRFEINLSSNLDFDKLVNNIIKYEYTENGINIPENQFGLGYANLMTIISQLIEYVEKYPSDEKHSKLNLIFIEEPEAFMHPQMQELFIKNINAAIRTLLNGSNKKINSQLIVTTHSSHILNSKIHASNSFNNINYIATINNNTHVINLNDKSVINNPDNSAIGVGNLAFLKKHIQFKLSDMFFSDAVIFVEGVTEETLLTYYINNDPNLKKYYITVVNINGAHGLVYHDLIKLIKIPALIITDLDIDRSEPEKNDFIQMGSLNGKITTNQTIIKFNANNKQIERLTNNFLLVDNIYVAFQAKQINSYYPTSFEEAYILTNFNNQTLNTVLLGLKPNIYKGIVGEDESSRILENLVRNSYKLQRKLSKSKSDFANTLLYEFIINESAQELPELPEYIKEGLEWLQQQLTHNPQVSHEPN